MAAYWPAFSGELLFDDIPLLVYQDCWRGIDRIPAMFSFDEGNPCTYRPVRWVSYALDHAIGGINPFLLHLSGFFYHLLTVLAVYRLFRRFAGPLPAAWTAGFWSLHPVLSDAVAYISGRRDILTTLFFVLALLMLIRPEGKPPRIGHYLGALLFFLVALGAKEMAVTLPVVWVGYLVATGWGRADRMSWLLRRHWPVLVLGLGAALGFTLYRGWLATHSAMAGRWWGGSAASNFATSFTLLAQYVKLVFWPVTLIGDYHPETIALAQGFSDWRTVVGILLSAVLLGLVALFLRRGWTASALGITWFLVTLLPVLHLFPHHELFAEHYLYLPLIGVMLALLPVVEGINRSHAPLRRPGILLLLLLALLLAGRTHLRSYDWQNEQAFYQAAFQSAPKNTRVRFYLGVNHAERGECDQALVHLDALLSSPERSAVMRREAAIARVMCNVLVGQPEVAEQEATEILPLYPGDSRLYYWRGRTRLLLDRTLEAIGDLKWAIAISRGRDPAHVLALVMAFNHLGRYPQALAIIDRYPMDSQQMCEQEVLTLVGLSPPQPERAMRRFSQCIERYPDSLVLLEWSALAAFASGQSRQAEQILERLRALGAPEETFRRIEQRRRERR